MQLSVSDRRVFLSYARIDDEVPSVDPGRGGWVRYFYDQLQTALRQRLAGDIAFWRDKKDVDENERFGPLIEQALREAKALVAVVSPSYLERQWCRYELEQYYEFQTDPSPDARAEKIVKILKHKIDENLLPEALRGRGGYAFYAEDSETQDEKPFFSTADCCAKSSTSIRSRVWSTTSLSA
jgi:hypothetical protein